MTQDTSHSSSSIDRELTARTLFLRPDRPVSVSDLRCTRASGGEAVCRSPRAGGDRRAGARGPDGATLAAIWPALGFENTEPAGLLYAVNREYAKRERPLADGDEVALIPPVSGGSFRLVEGPIDVDAVIAEVADERAGAVATFQEPCARSPGPRR